MQESEIELLSVDIKEKARLTLDILRDNYFADSRPWVIAYSGGKDSTLLLQLVYELLIELGNEAKKAIYILSSDTLVESPRIEEHIRSTMAALEVESQRHSLGLICKIVTPRVEETFWAKLIGKGYPPPTRTFRWCTKSIKIQPTRRYIDNITAHHGSVILLLGTRLAESSARRQRMLNRNNNARGMNPHGEIANALVMTPLIDWETEEVWEYLIRGPKPDWTRNNNILAELYRDASGGECPLVLDLTSPSCGGSRFGCWTCTVVRQDRSLQGFIDSGDGTLVPFLEYRNWLREIREDDSRRLTHRRDGSPGLGPFDGNTRKEMLDRLLEIEKLVDRQIISNELICYIQSVWSKEFDLACSAYDIAAKHGRQIQQGGSSMSLDEEQNELLSFVAQEESVPPILLQRLFLLSEEFPDLTAWGAKSRLRASIKDVIEAAAGDNEGNGVA